MGSWNLAHRGTSKPHGKGESFRKFPKVPKMKFSDIGEGLRVRPITFRRNGFSAKTMKTSQIKKRVKDTPAYFTNSRDDPCGHRAFSLFSPRPCGGEHFFACEDAGPFLRGQPLSLRGASCLKPVCYQNLWQSSDPSISVIAGQNR